MNFKNETTEWIRARSSNPRSFGLGPLVLTHMMAHFLHFCAGLLLPSPHILSSAVRCKPPRQMKNRDHWRSSIVLKTQAVPPLPPSSSTSKYTISPAAPPRSTRRPLRASTAKVRKGTPLRPPGVLRAQSRADHWSPSWLAPCRAITSGSRAVLARLHAMHGQERRALGWRKHKYVNDGTF